MHDSHHTSEIGQSASNGVIWHVSSLVLHNVWTIFLWFQKHHLIFYFAYHFMMACCRYITSNLTVNVVQCNMFSLSGCRFQCRHTVRGLPSRAPEAEGWGPYFPLTKNAIAFQIYSLQKNSLLMEARDSLCQCGWILGVKNLVFLGSVLEQLPLVVFWICFMPILETSREWKIQNYIQNVCIMPNLYITFSNKHNMWNLNFFICSCNY